MVKKKSGLVGGSAIQTDDLIGDIRKQADSLKNKADQNKEAAASETPVKENENSQSEMVLSVRGNFNLTEDKDINKFLEDKAREILFINAKSAVALGSVFQEVADRLSGNNHHDGAYIKWLDMNGYNKATAHRYRVRYNLFEKSATKEGKGLIACLPQKYLSAINKHEDVGSVIEIIDQGSTKEELDEILFIKALPSKKEKIYDPAEAIEGFNSFFTGFTGFEPENIKEEDAKEFNSDMEKVKKIMSKWI